MRPPKLNSVEPPRYGSVCQVVWEGRCREASPYPDQSHPDSSQTQHALVLRTNAKVTPLQAVLRYRDLLLVEDLFRRTKAIMRTRPIFHSSDAAIRGHVFCSFLALAMQKHLDDLLRQSAPPAEVEGALA